MTNRRQFAGAILAGFACAFVLAVCTAHAKDAAPPTPPVQKAPAKLDLNTATDKELLELPGVGEVTAKKIVGGRPYKTVEDLAKAGLTEKEIAKIAPLVTVGTAKPPAAANSPINVNTATQKELETLPGIGEVTAAKIVSGRPYKTVQDLMKAGVSDSQMEKIKALVVVGAASDSKVDLNVATAKELEELPGIGKVKSEKIVANRPYKAVADLEKAGLTAQEISKIEALVTIGVTEARVPPEKGMVWVNTGTGIYHLPGDRWYGKTKEGKFMTEAAAKAAGFHESKEDDHAEVKPK